jgi:hypothetical protein
VGLNKKPAHRQLEACMTLIFFVLWWISLAGRGSRNTSSTEQKMSSLDNAETTREDDATPEWHRARAKRLRMNGFSKMAEEHEQLALIIERRQQQAK